jgi:ABC-type transport system involved in multi-copper enzyme maturation permease subunit
MLFSLGPVMRYELITTSRRRRYYVLKVVYGLVLLAQLWMLFRDWEAQQQPGARPMYPGWVAPSRLDEIQAFAEDAFIQFAGVQGLALLVLIPALVAGIIPDEYQRKTLHYLLASRLSSAEIVLGKLGARLVHVIAFVALGLPIVSLLMLYGGLNPVNIFYVYIGTATLVLFASGFSILVSVLARRPRDAIVAAYGLGAIWLLAPVTAGRVSTFLENGPLGWVHTANQFLLVTNPVHVWSLSTQRSYDWARGGTIAGWAASWNSFEFYFALMSIVQASFGLLFLGLAVAGLRPLRGSAWPGGIPQTGWFTRIRKRFHQFVESRATAALTRNALLASRTSRPPCGEDPMLWKERFTRMGGGLKWLGSRPVALFFIVLLCCYLADLSGSVFGDLIRGTRRTRIWDEINSILRTSSASLAVLAILPISAAAASSITSEREGDTWISLATTLLTPVEVIRSKQFGAIWCARWLGIGLIAILAAGLLLGAIHPIGLLAGIAILVTSAWMTSAIGVLASTLARNSTRALFVTAVLVSVFVMLSSWPAGFWASLASYRDMRYMWSGDIATGYSQSSLVAPPLAGAAAIAAVNSAVAALLTFWSVRRLRSTWGSG